MSFLALHSPPCPLVGDSEKLTSSSTPRRVLNPTLGTTVVDATRSPSRALPSIISKPSALRVGVVAVAAGAVTSTAAGFTWANTVGANAETPSSVSETTDIAAARQSRFATDSGLSAAFTSRSADRQNAATVTQATVDARAAALTKTTQQVEAAGLKDALQQRVAALTKTATSVEKEEERRKEDGWLPGGKNPSFLRPVQGGSFTSPFGYRTNPVTGASELHSGQDIGIGCGTPILAPQDGTVTFVGWYGSGGNALRIDHGKYNGKEIESGYYHAQGYIVTNGQKVTRGQVVGYVGTTGTSSGCHLHYMIFEDGTNVNPVPYIG